MNHFHCIIRFCFAFILCINAQNANAFDWRLYVQKYPDLVKAGINNWHDAFNHYLTYGIYEGRVTAVEKPPSTGFDWRYYVEQNKLSLDTEPDALKHYQEHGFFLNLPYCKPYTFIILLHLYSLDLMDEFIEHINYFMHLNPCNQYCIMINVPVDRNIDEFFNNKKQKKKIADFFLDNAQLPGDCLVHDQFNLKNNKNSKKLDCIVRYFLHGLNSESRNVQFLFSPNRGRDIGGFFLQLNQIIQQDIEHDYLVKIHSKKSPHAHALWRKLNTSFLRIHINPMLRDYDCIYSNRLAFNFYDECVKNKGNTCAVNQGVNCGDMAKLLNFFNLPPRNFNFCGGTMFVVPHTFTDFFKKYDLLQLFNMLNEETKFAKALDGRIEHGFERFFGYLIEYLGLKTYCLDYQPLPSS